MRTVTVNVEELQRMQREGMAPDVAAAMEALRSGHRKNVRGVVGRFALEALVLIGLLVGGLGVAAAAIHSVKGCGGGSVVCAQR